MSASNALDRLFQAVRAACSPGDWSRGVELTRAGAVVAEAAEDDDELRFRITYRGGMISRNVTLWPDDAEWDCACGAGEEGCEHAAAAVIASRRSAEGGPGVRSADEAGRVEYRFTRQGGMLALERWIVRGEVEAPLRATLAAVAEGRVDGPRFSASQEDLAAELALGTHRRGPLDRADVARVFRALRRASGVRFEGEPAEISTEPVSPRVVVEDRGDAFRLRPADPDDVDETFANGVARCGAALRPLAEPRWSGRERHRLERGWIVPPDEVATLVTDVLPALERGGPVEIRTDRLPRTTRAAEPRIQLDVAADPRGVEVLATLVYGDPTQARVDGGRLVHLAGAVPVRDEAAERRLVRRLDRQVGLAPGMRERCEGAAAVGLRARLEAWDAALQAPGLDRFRLAPPLVAQAAVREDGLDLDFVSTGGAEGAGGAGRGGRADPAAVVAAWRAGESLVPLLDGGFAPLPADWLARHGHRVADLLAARDAAGRVAPPALPDLARFAEELAAAEGAAVAAAVPERLRRLRDALREGAERPPAALPPDLQADLRDYQRRGVDWMAFLGDHGLGALLADDMGLGKTVQALCAVRGKTLVVAPTSVLFNWRREAERFRPGLAVCTYHGPDRALDEDADLVLTSYALLRLDRETLAGRSWDTVVLDESQAIKNPDSQAAAAAFALRAERRIALTGTPVENRLDELWSQMRFLNPGLLGDRDDFRERYAAPVGAGEAEAAARLRERVRPFVLRRLKDAVAPELPPRIDIELHCDLDDNEREIYDAIRAATRRDVVARLRSGGSVIEALEALLRLRQAACHSGLIPGHEAEGSSKLALLLDQLDAVVAEDHKALVFSQWTALLDRTEPHLRAAGIEFLRLDGATRDRQAVVEGFQADEGPPVLLVSLKAGGTGLNLTAADHVFLLDLWWNPAVEDQAADRAHRLGQERPVMVHRLIATDTVEEKILALQASKRDLARAALGEPGEAAATLGREELLDLLGA